MFVLDTNILSAMMRPEPPPELRAWLSGHMVARLFTTSITQAEIAAGIELLPESPRRTALETTARVMFDLDFDDRILPFDTSAATLYAQLFAVRKRGGRPAGIFDLMIAAIARSRNAGLITRNDRDFDGCGLAIINPWKNKAR